VADQIEFIHRSPHAQTKYGAHAGIRTVTESVFMYARNEEYAVIFLEDLRSRFAVTTFVVYGFSLSIKMPQLDLSTYIVQVSELYTVWLLLYMLLWSGTFLKTYLYLAFHRSFRNVFYSYYIIRQAAIFSVFVSFKSRVYKEHMGYSTTVARLQTAPFLIM
jgi:hypothetical protein